MDYDLTKPPKVYHDIEAAMAEPYDPDWERKLFLDFVNRHPTVDILALSAGFGKPVEWCKDRLHYHALEQLASHCADQRMICPLNVLALSRLTHEEQSRFIRDAVKLEPTDFRIAIDSFIRTKVRAVRISVITIEEVAADALSLVPVLRTKVARFKCHAESLDEQLGSVRAAYRRAVGPDPDRFYKD